MKYWIWLSLACTPGSQTFASLLGKFDTAREIYNADDHEIASAVTSRSRDYEALTNKSLEQAELVFDFCASKNVGILTYADDRYPDSLRDIPTPPVLLYYRGILPDFNRRLCVSIVGTRSMSAYGLRQAYKMSYELATAGAVVVSGMAKGIDGVAAGAAIKSGGATVAVLGCGVDVAYPTHHKPLSIEIAKAGVVLSEYAPGTRPNSYHFPMRNRIISGLSQATVVIEAGIGSGSLITAKDAILQGRDVFAIPANVGSKGADGTNGLLRDGAKMALSADDVLAPYQYSYAESLTLEKYKSGKALENIDLAHLCTSARGSYQTRCRYPIHGIHRGRGSKTLCQHLFGTPCELLQRVRHLRRDERARHPIHHQRRMSRPTYRHTLQQPIVWLRRLLSA